jgi:hypothetical protein
MLTDQQLKDFDTKGWVRLKQAFAPQAALKMQDFMWEQLGQMHGINRKDPSTWIRHFSGLNKKTRDSVYREVGTPRLFGAVDQLLGKDRWQRPPGWGGFLVSPPDSDEGPWDVINNQWHWDGDPAHQVDGINALFTLTFYSTVEPGGGGTLLLEGSHRLIVPFFRPLGPDRSGFKQKPLKRRFLQSHPFLAELNGYAPDQGDRVRRFMQEGATIDDVPVRVIEATGEPGDALFAHPSILHARSYNRAPEPRFMRVGSIGPKHEEA